MSDKELIAELVDALQKVDKWIMSVWTEDDVRGDEINPAFRDALLATRAAIAKATGA